MQFSDPCRIDAYAGTGNALSIAANRISYLLDFRGPSIAIDTACSSSLVAVHLACRSLRSGESTLATGRRREPDPVAPTITINFSKAGVMAPDGRCKAFDARRQRLRPQRGRRRRRAEAALERALADGDPIYAVIRGSAVNQDGRSNGLMAPNPLAQEAVLREAYRRAGVSPGAFNTSRRMAPALSWAIRSRPRRSARCSPLIVQPGVFAHWARSKPISAISRPRLVSPGLIKVALELKYRELLPSLHFREPNPHIPFEALPLRVQTAAAPWPSDSGPALAGVTSLGFGGTNAHVVLEEAPQPHFSADSRVYHESREAEDSRSGIRNSNSTHLLPLSARSPEALQALARAYLNFLAAPCSDASLGDICHTASARRSHHDYRLAVTGASCKQLIEGLAAFLRSETSSRALFRAQRFKPSEKTRLRVSRAGLSMVGHGTRAFTAGGGFSRGHRTMRPCDGAVLLLVFAYRTRGYRCFAVAAERDRRPPADPVCDSSGAGGAVALLGYRTAGRGRAQHGRGRGIVRRWRIEPGGCGPGHLPAQPSDQTHHRKRSYGGGRTFDRRGRARSDRLRRSACPSPPATAPAQPFCPANLQRSKQFWIDCGVRASSAPCSRSISLRTARRWIPCALIYCGHWTY